MHLKIPLGLLLIGGFVWNCQPDSNPDRGIQALSSWNQMVQNSGGLYRQFSSFDRSLDPSNPIIRDGNKDFNNFLNTCGHAPDVATQVIDGLPGCEAGMSGYLIAAADGPGFVSRIWMTSKDPLSNKQFEDEEILVYVDDMKIPAYGGRLGDWIEGNDGPFQFPLAGWSSGSLVSYVPMSYNSKLRILLNNLHKNAMYYYQVDVKTSEPTEPFRMEVFRPELIHSLTDLLSGELRSASELSPLVDEQKTLVPGKKLVVLDYSGPGTIQRMSFGFDQITEETLLSLTLRLFWDEQTEPAVEIPLAYFFGCAQKIASFRTLPMEVSQDGSMTHLTCFLPMAFRRHAVAELESIGTEEVVSLVTIQMTNELPQDGFGYFHAVFHQQKEPAEANSTYPVADIQGSGNYIGTMMFLEGRAIPDYVGGHPLNFLEGDELGLIDGEERIVGTGTEDYFNGGFYFENGLFEQPFGSLIHLDQDLSSQNGMVTVVRWHILSDLIGFRDSFSLSFEYGPNLPETMIEYSSVAYYYLQ